MDTAAFLGQALGLEATYAPGRFKTRMIEDIQYPSYSGLAILSKNAPVSAKVSLLPPCAADPDRMLLSARFDFKHVRLILTNTHLTHVAGKDDVRKKQLVFALNQTSHFAFCSHSPAELEDSEKIMALCCGDFNFELDAVLLGQLQYETGAVIKDCYLNAGGKLPGNTWGFEQQPCRLDYILGLQGSGFSSPCHANGRVILAGKDASGVCASDHLGVMVDFML